MNKKDKFEKPEISKKYDLNTYSINTRNIQTNKKKRESSKSHFYHEINTTKKDKDKDKDTDKLTSNSLSHLFNEGNDELDTSINTNKISVNSNITERTHLQRYTININTQKNYLKNNPLKGEGDTSGRLSNRFHRNNINNKVLNNSLNKDHHRYYESKSIKKNRNNYIVFNDYSAKKIIMIIIIKNIKVKIWILKIKRIKIINIFILIVILLIIILKQKRRIVKLHIFTINNE